MSDDAEAIAAYLLPKGKRAAGEWKAGSVSGEEGRSLSVRITGAKKGVWSDFANGDAGDLLDLWAACRSLSIAEAITEAKAYLGVRDDHPRREQKTYRRPESPRAGAAKARGLEWLKSRGLTDETIAAFCIAEQQQGGKTFVLLPFLRRGADGSNELVNVKYRNVDDKRDMRQEAGAEPCLFGWHLIQPRCRSIAITEGEIDTMTLHQVGIPALSVNQGAGNHQWIETEWDRLEAFSEIFVCFDDDDAGKKGAAEVAQRLGIERCKVVKFGAKDANQWLQDGADGEEFHHALKTAKHLDPDEMAPMVDFMGAVKALFYPAHDAPRYPVLVIGRKEHPWFEFRPGEYTVWTGINGHGKSLMLNQVQLGLMDQDQRVMVFSGEMAPDRQGKRLVKQATGLDRPTPGYIDAVGEWVRDRMWLFNLVGTARLDRLLEVFSYGARRYGIQQFVIDSLMMTDVPEDGPGALSAQKLAVQKITHFARSTGGHIHLVAHPRKGADERNAPGKLDVSGSSKITDAADNVFSVWSARKEETAPLDDKPDALLELQKQRHGDVQHMKVFLFFNRQAQQFCNNSSRHAVPFVQYDAHPVTVPIGKEAA